MAASGSTALSAPRMTEPSHCCETEPSLGDPEQQRLPGNGFAQHQPQRTRSGKSGPSPGGPREPRDHHEGGCQGDRAEQRGKDGQRPAQTGPRQEQRDGGGAHGHDQRHSLAVGLGRGEPEAERGGRQKPPDPGKQRNGQRRDSGGGEAGDRRLRAQQLEQPQHQRPAGQARARPLAKPQRRRCSLAVVSRAAAQRRQADAPQRRRLHQAAHVVEPRLSGGQRRAQLSRMRPQLGVGIQRVVHRLAQTGRQVGPQRGHERGSRRPSMRAVAAGLRPRTGFVPVQAS